MSHHRASLVIATAALVGGAWACSGSSSATDPSSADAGTATPDGGSVEPADGSTPPPPVDGGAEASTPIQVAGQVFSRAFDLALAQADIAYTGGGTTQTKADGTFTFTAPGPYTLTITHSDPTLGKTVDVFEGLTATAPVLESGRFDTHPSVSAQLKGKLVGIGDTIPPSTHVRVQVGSTGNSVSNAVFDPGDGTTFALFPAWKGSTSRSLTVRALAYEDSGGYPTAFTGYGETTLTVNENDINDNVQINLAPPATKTINGTFNPVSFSGALFTELWFYPRLTHGGAFDFGKPAGSPFSLLVPDLPGATVRVGYSDATVATSRVAPASNTMSFDVISPPTLVGPADQATYAPGTTFSWNAPPGTSGIYCFVMEATGADPWLFVWTKATSVTVPAAFTPAPGKAYSWFVRHYADVPNVDAITTGNGDVGTYTTVGRKIVVP